MERKKSLERLSAPHTNINDKNYLHYSSYHNALIASIKKYARGEVIDIGCGNKPYLSCFENITKYIGCDIIQSNLNIVDIVCPANKIPIEDEKFDTVFSTQAIEHIEDFEGMISEAYRLLKPKGYFLLSGPFYWPLHEEPYDFFRFSKYGFKYILEKKGFEVIKIIPNGGIWANAGLTLIDAIESTTPKTLKDRILLSLYHRLNLRRYINKKFDHLDKLHFDERGTINYVIIARK